MLEVWFDNNSAYYSYRVPRHLDMACWLCIAAAVTARGVADFLRSLCGQDGLKMRVVGNDYVFGQEHFAGKPVSDKGI